jgi:Uma2 family endonuclease
MAVTDKIEQQILTGEDLSRLGDIGPCELVEGRIVPMSPTGYLHGKLEGRLTALLVAFADEHWEVLTGETGIYTRRNPDTVRGADVALISRQRAAQRRSASFLDVAPELVVEILSPDARWSDIMTKLAEYFAVGVQRVWVLDPKLRSLFAYRSLTDVQQFTAEQTLTDEELLPGFALSLARLFRD